MGHKFFEKVYGKIFFTKKVFPYKFKKTKKFRELVGIFCVFG